MNPKTVNHIVGCPAPSGVSQIFQDAVYNQRSCSLPFILIAKVMSGYNSYLIIALYITNININKTNKVKCSKNPNNTISTPKSIHFPIDYK
jgi:hypothetical protein